jgi:D-glycero-D-manno-heptose 1,7-bisphosphate phosphatase
MCPEVKHSDRAGPGVFLDRDGTVTVERGYISSPQDVEFYPNSVEAIRRLNRIAVPVVVVSNQSGIARGLLTENKLKQIHARMEYLLRSQGVHIDGVYYCPHHPDFGPPKYRRDCDCRKPATGMLREASRQLNIDLSSSYVVGDKTTDVMLGKNAGCASVLVLTGFGTLELERLGASTVDGPDFVAPDLLAAADWIIEQMGRIGSSQH